jgi:hypothetical protein
MARKSHDQQRTPFLHSVVRPEVELVMPAAFCCRTRDPFARDEHGNPYASFQFPGDHTARVTPVPIPNTEVKPRRADDTARATVWERRSSPGLN